MKFRILMFLSVAISLSAAAQPTWKFSKEKDGIRIYTGTTENSKFKSIRVRCELPGSISRLQSILRDVMHHTDWVYRAKNSSLVKQVTPDEIFYYMETETPWPVTNRDGVYHISMRTDSLRHSFSALVVSAPGYVPEQSGKIRVVNSKATWAVTEAGGKINIDYALEIDPAGSIPAWMVNMFCDKGPYETFKNLEALLKK